MDENYLDNLLNEFSLDKEIDNHIEEELDEQIKKEKDERILEQTVSRDESFDLDLKQDAEGGALEADINFSEDQIDELDQLDNLADMDFGNLDFADLDFDDLDITKLSGEEFDSGLDDLLKDFDGDFKIPSFDDFGETSGTSGNSDFDSLFEDGLGMDKQEDGLSDTPAVDNSDKAVDESNGVPDEQIDDNTLSGPDDNKSGNEKALAEDVEGNGSEDDLNEDNFDADSFLDSLLEEDLPVEEQADNVNNIDAPDESNIEEMPSSEKEEDDNSDKQNNDDNVASLDDMLSGGSPLESGEGDNAGTGEGDLLSDEDLFSMLGMDDQSAEKATDNDLDKAIESSTETAPDVSALEGIEDIEDISEKPKKKKRSFMEILFGPPDEDDEPTEEELQAIEAKNAAKKAKKEAAAEAKKAKAEKDKADKSRKDADKKRSDAEKAKVKAEKKAKKKAVRDAEAANAEPEKKLNKPAVIFIFSILLGGVGFFYLSSVDFNYKQAIEHAANYFASQKYHKAYDEIKGVDVKEKDKDLKERIYTVMYVERLYEGYENNLMLGRQKKALDSLLRGVEKYYEYYDEAKELDIVSDLDYSFAQIQNALQQNYGITVERALEINDLNDYDYMKTIELYTGDDEKE